MVYRIRVPRSWLAEGAAIELELPRNLKCAACEGGGCDRCERSGAISVRGRGEPIELLGVTLPKRGDDFESTASGRTVVLRIPERGGVSTTPGEPPGQLLLQVGIAEQPDSGVVRVVREEIVVPEEAEARLSRPTLVPSGVNRTVLLVAILVALWIALLVWLRVTGRA